MNRNKGILLAAVGALIWSTGGVFIKLVDAPGIYIAASRSLVAGLAFLPFVKFKRLKVTKNLLLLIFSYSYTLIAFVLATKLTTAANAIILQHTAPIWLFVYYAIRYKKFDTKKILPVLFVALGIFVFLLEPKNGTNVVGNLLALSAGAAFAGVAHFSAKDHGVSGPGLISICNLATFLIALPFVSNIVKISASLDILAILGIIFLGTIQIALGYVFYIKSLKFISPLDTSLICLLEPLTNPIWVLIFVGEVPTAYAIVGSALILIGIVVNILRDRKKAVA